MQPLPCHSILEAGSFHSHDLIAPAPTLAQASYSNFQPGIQWGEEAAHNSLVPPAYRAHEGWLVPAWHAVENPAYSSFSHLPSSNSTFTPAPHRVQVHLIFPSGWTIADRLGGCKPTWVQ